MNRETNTIGSKAQDIAITKKVVDIKSILGLMSLVIPQGENVVVVANGDQAEAAIDAIAEILEK